MSSWNRPRDYLKRTAGSKGPPKQSFLIVCEGERTEPSYFEAFRVTSAEVDITGTGFNTDTLVQYAIQKKNDADASKDAYDQVWCVFDRDSFPPNNFNRALSLAKANDIRIAFTNEAFELWYLLHFHFYNTGISRNQYIGLLSKLLGRPYKKNDRDIYDLLLDKQPQAIKFATNLLATYSPSNPCNDNPSTAVHLLVLELNKYL